MKGLFYLLALIVWISGLAQFYTSGYDLALVLSSLMTIIHGFAWFAVAMLWGSVDNSTERLIGLEKSVGGEMWKTVDNPTTMTLIT